MPKVSIVLPVYNGEKYLEQALSSIVHQSFEDWELIIIDDCSTDTTPSIISNWIAKDPRIRSYRNSTNLKIPGSLNNGFSHAKGDYYTWTSDDNLFREDALAIMVEALESKPKCDLVYCNINRIDANGQQLSFHGFNGPPSFIYLFNVVQACFLYRKEVHDRLGGYDENLFLVEDYDFWLRAYRNSRFAHLKEAPYYYRMHENSLTSTKTKEIRRRACMLMKREASCPTTPLAQRILAAIGFIYNQAQYRAL